MSIEYDIRRSNGRVLYLPANPEDASLKSIAFPDVYVADTLQKYPLGTEYDEGTGRDFRYAQNDNSGNTLVPGRMVQQNSEDGQMTGLVPAAASIGDTTVTLTIGTGAIVANQFENGWLFVEGPAGASAEKGFTYQIESHPAASGSATCVFTLRRALIKGISTARRVSVYSNPIGSRKSTSRGCKVVPAGGQTFIAVGIPACRVTQAQFFWAQYKGICGFETDGSTAMVKGQRVSIGGASDGCGMVSGGNTDQIFGVCITAGGFSRLSLVALDLPEIAGGG
ncbi:hypothetical protein LCGC14_0872950 [marine sediment metagenome]|uniref:Uncharacterized protein n=1 Tax=marine sediment metagenome TaxID=412755 RepID=A0A0F9PPR9_9ZZZZ